MNKGTARSTRKRRKLGCQKVKSEKFPPAAECCCGVQTQKSKSMQDFKALAEKKNKGKG